MLIRRLVCVGETQSEFHLKQNALAHLLSKEVMSRVNSVSCNVCLDACGVYIHGECFNRPRINCKFTDTIGSLGDSSFYGDEDISLELSKDSDNNGIGLFKVSCCDRTLYRMRIILSVCECLNSILVEWGDMDTNKWNALLQKSINDYNKYISELEIEKSFMKD
jgi:hypothetical protein